MVNNNAMDVSKHENLEVHHYESTSFPYELLGRLLHQSGLNS